MKTLKTLCKLSSAALAIAVSTNFAQAADVVSMPDWSGFYLGAQAGYGMGNMTDSKYCSEVGGNVGSVSVLTGSGPATCDNPDIVAVTALSNKFAGPWDTVDDFSDISGWLAGARMGYNHQFGSFVLGAELAGSVSSMTDDGASLVDVNFATEIDSFESYYEATIDVNWLVTATAKLGYALSPDFMVSANGGLALVNTKFQSSAGYSDTSTNHGLTAGIGAEYRVTKNASITADYRHIWLNDIEYRGSSLFGLIDNQHEYDLGLDLVTVGFNYYLN